MAIRGSSEDVNVVFVDVFAVEWSCLKDFSLLAGEMVLDNLQSLKCTISGLTTVTRASRLHTVIRPEHTKLQSVCSTFTTVCCV